MKDFKGTPGPWFGLVDGHCNNKKNTWSLDDNESASSESCPITLEDGTIVAFAVASDTKVFWDDRISDNANLIAAAPELLEALQELFADYKQLADSGDAGFWDLEDTEVGKKSLAAIAKALGK